MNKKKSSKQVIVYIVIAGIVSIIITSLGSLMLITVKENPWIGILTIILAFLLLYFSFYSFQIKSNQDKIKEIEEWKENKEELLNTLKDIIILKKVGKIK